MPSIEGVLYFSKEHIRRQGELRMGRFSILIVPSPMFFTALFCHPWCWHHPQDDRRTAAIFGQFFFQKPGQLAEKTLWKTSSVSPGPEWDHRHFPKPITYKANKNNREDDEEELDGGCLSSYPLSCVHRERCYRPWGDPWSHQWNHLGCFRKCQSQNHWIRISRARNCTCS